MRGRTQFEIPCEFIGGDVTDVLGLWLRLRFRIRFYWNCRWDIERGHGRGKGEAAGFNAGRDPGDAAVVGVDFEVAEEVKAPEVDKDGGGG